MSASAQRVFEESLDTAAHEPPGDDDEQLYLPDIDDDVVVSGDGLEPVAAATDDGTEEVELTDEDLRELLDLEPATEQTATPTWTLHIDESDLDPPHAIRPGDHGFHDAPTLVRTPG